jgi:hypothetical protein
MAFNAGHDRRPDADTAFQYGGDGDYLLYNTQDYVKSMNNQYFLPVQDKKQKEHDFQEATPYYPHPSIIPSVPSHQRAWSGSTISTHTGISQGKHFLPPPSDSAKKGRLFSTNGSWIPETIAVAVALAAVGSILGVLEKFNGHALPEWPYYITLNALIALLAAVATAAMNVSVQNSMSQLKWIRFSQSSVRLSDMEAFDEASRGTWGAVKLLFTARGG